MHLSLCYYSSWDNSTPVYLLYEEETTRHQNDMQICDYMIHNLKMFSMCVLNAKKNVSMMVNAKNNFNLYFYSRWLEPLAVTSLFQTWFVMILGSFHLLKMLGDKRKSFGEQFSRKWYFSRWLEPYDNVADVRDWERVIVHFDRGFCYWAPWESS